MTDLQPVVYVVDDDAFVRRYLATLLETHAFRVMALASAEELLGRGALEGPGCLILDVFLPGLSGLDVQQILMEEFRHLPIVFISGQGSIPMSVQAMKSGAVDFLTKPLDSAELVSAVERAIGLSNSIRAGQAEHQELAERLERLSPREVEVIRRVAAGKLNKQIAVELDIVEKTVKVHRSRAMRKLGLRSVADLARLAEKLDFFPPPSV